MSQSFPPPPPSMSTLPPHPMQSIVPSRLECSSCIQAERIRASELTLEAVLQLLGKREDRLTGEKGEGLVHAFERMSLKLDEYQTASQKTSQDARVQTTKEFDKINIQLAALRHDHLTHKEAPTRLLKWLAVALPVVALIVSAVMWLLGHVQVVR